MKYFFFSFKLFEPLNSMHIYSFDCILALTNIPKSSNICRKN